MSTSEGIATMTAEELDACIGAYQDLALAIVDNTTSETMSVTYPQVEVARDPDVDPNTNDGEGGAT